MPPCEPHNSFGILGPAVLCLRHLVKDTDCVSETLHSRGKYIEQGKLPHAPLSSGKVLCFRLSFCSVCQQIPDLPFRVYFVCAPCFVFVVSANRVDALPVSEFLLIPEKGNMCLLFAHANGLSIVIGDFHFNIAQTVPEISPSFCYGLIDGLFAMLDVSGELSWSIGRSRLYRAVIISYHT